MFSFKSREEIDELVRESTERPAARIGQRALAEEVTTLVHGAEETGRAIAASRALFGQGSLTDLDERTLAAVAAEVRPGPERSPGRQQAAAGVAPTVSAARRAIAGGGAYLNNQKVTDEASRCRNLMAAVPDPPPGQAVSAGVAADHRREAGAYLNNRRSPTRRRSRVADDLLHGRYLILRRGKRTVGAVEVIRHS